MQKCKFENINKLELFNSNYKVKLKGTVSINKFHHLYILESHGKLYFLEPNNQKEELIIHDNINIEELNKLEQIGSNCHKYEEEIIIDKTNKLFTTNVFSIVPNSDAYFINDTETLLIPCPEIQKIIGKKLFNTPKEEFFKYLKATLKNNSLDNIIDEMKSIKEPITKITKEQTKER